MPLQVHPEGKIPVLRDAVGPPELPEDIRPYHEDTPPDHLHRSQKLLSHPLPDVAAAVLAPDPPGYPVLVLVETMQLVALDDTDPVPVIPSLDLLDEVPLIIFPILEAPEKPPQDVPGRDEIDDQRSILLPLGIRDDVEHVPDI